MAGTPAAARPVAKQYAEENSWLDKEAITYDAVLNLRAYHNTWHIFDAQLIGTPKLTVTYNHHIMTIWCECLVSYNVNGKDHFAKISMDVDQAGKYNRAESFIVDFAETSQSVIERDAAEID